MTKGKKDVIRFINGSILTDWDNRDLPDSEDDIDDFFSLCHSIEERKSFVRKRKRPSSLDAYAITIMKLYQEHNFSLTSICQALKTKEPKRFKTLAISTVKRWIEKHEKLK